MSNGTVKRPEGCKNLHIAIITHGSGGYTVTTPERIYGLESAEYSYGYLEAQGYSDNIIDTSVKKPSYADLTFTLRQLSSALEAKMMGKTYKAGKKYTNTKDIAPMLVVLWEQTNSDGSSTFMCFYNCNLAKDSGTNTTTGEGIEYDTITISGKAIPFPVTGDIDMMMESDDTGITEDDIANFFKKVVLPGVTPPSPAEAKADEEKVEAVKIEKKKENK